MSSSKQKIVMVESPAKAKTLGKILGRNYIVKASLGHVRDLPKSRFGIDIENNFSPKYVVPKTKNKIVRELKQLMKTTNTVYLATDPDREGEAISWHLIESTKSSKINYRRVVFNEITKKAIEFAFKHPRDIDMHLVNAQQARRILDRLVGYKISPLLWHKVRRGLSAGRVQSVTLKIIIDREKDIDKFIPQEYWTIEAELTRNLIITESGSFRAMLIGFTNGTKIEPHNEDEASDICSELRMADYSVVKIKTKKLTRQPSPPFITSSMQQEAWNKLHFTAKQTMAIAQQLYEGLPIGREGSIGLITYMRTDSTKVANSAILETREFIGTKYGEQYLPSHARSFARSTKWIQEAHEAIRPTNIYREPSIIKSHLTPSQFKLYQLIWKRMVASQMSAAVFDNIAVDIKASCAISRINYLLRASNSVSKFFGFMILYTEVKDEADEKKDEISFLHQLSKGDELNLVELFHEQHFTQPPSHFTEASLIKVLEQWGIGRPSTYAPTLSTIQERGYVSKLRGNFRPTELGLAVNDLMVIHFSDIVNTEFTAQLEEKLDEIANENRDWVNTIQKFYTPFSESLKIAAQVAEKVKLSDESTDEICTQCNQPLIIKFGRYGKFFACSNYPECKYTKPFQIKTGVECPECGSELVEKISKKKRTFYGCSKYPNCKFATSLKPLSKPCPKCGGLITKYRRGIKCTKCTYQSALESDSE